MRLLIPHGLGDIVQALPALKRYAEKTGPLSLGVLNRLPGCSQLLSGFDWVEEVWTCNDPWNDFARPNTIEGYTDAMNYLGRLHNARPIWTRPPDDELDPRWSKAIRFADELGVEWWGDKPELPEAFTNLPAVNSGRARVAVHGDSGNPVKDTPVEALSMLAMAHSSTNRTRTLPLTYEDGEPQPVMRQVRFIAACDLFVGIDSAPAHLASLTDTPVIWVFSSTPIQQAIPLYPREAETMVYCVGPNRMALLESWQRWREANRGLVLGEIDV